MEEAVAVYVQLEPAYAWEAGSHTVVKEAATSDSGLNMRGRGGRGGGTFGVGLRCRCMAIGVFVVVGLVVWRVHGCFPVWWGGRALLNQRPIARRSGRDRRDPSIPTPSDKKVRAPPQRDPAGPPANPWASANPWPSGNPLGGESTSNRRQRAATGARGSREEVGPVPPERRSHQTTPVLQRPFRPRAALP